MSELKRKLLIERNTTHGLSKTRLYKIFQYMKQRCYNPKKKEYKNYGGRGITICEEWLNDFINFYNWAICNDYNDDLTIDRIDVNKNYCPENCRWITKTLQNKNTRYTDKIKEGNEVLSLNDWVKKHKISKSTIYHYMQKGMTKEQAINFIKDKEINYV